MKTEAIDLGGPFPFYKIKKGELVSPEIQQQHFTVGQFLQFYQIVENNFTAMLYEISELKKLQETKTSSLELQDKVYDNLKEVLETHYKNTFVAITYDGKILASASDNVGLLNKLKELKYSSSQIFIRKVGTKAVAGWV